MPSGFRPLSEVTRPTYGRLASSVSVAGAVVMTLVDGRDDGLIGLKFRVDLVQELVEGGMKYLDGRCNGYKC